MPGNGLDLRVEEVSKQFGETRALSEVSLGVRPGTVHALVGENGAGKSTLGRIISGVIRPDAGQVVIDDVPVALGSPRDALDRGIATIAQELALVPALDAAENALLGVEPRRLGFIRRAEMRGRYRELAESVGFDIPAGRPVAGLSIAQQQQVEILRALARDARLIVMDEPTARLSTVEAGKLRAIIRAFAKGGGTVLLISHFLDEVLEVADEVSVLRDGRVVRHALTSGETEASLINAMLGRDPGAQFPARRLPSAGAPVALAVRSLSGPGFRDVSLEVRAGEILGLAGLVGAGRTEVARAIVGAARPTAGEIVVKGRLVRIRSPRDARRHGLLMLPESRRDDGLFPLRPARESVTAATLDELSRAGFVDLARERRLTADVLRRVEVAASGETPAAALSGGNQQKLLVARAMLARPAVLVADEPTRGVDVGAKRAIYELLVGLAERGMAILLISSEMDEILGLAHRVAVMRAGRIVRELRGAEIVEETILAAAFEARPNGAVA